MYDTGYSYALTPEEYEFLPTVTNGKQQVCTLGLWNIDVEQNSMGNSQYNQFAIGQNFIRKYNMTIRFTERNDFSNNISLSVFIGKTDKKLVILPELLMALFTWFLLLGFVGYMTVLKFRRVRSEKAEFQKIEKGAQNISAADARRIVKAQRLEAEFIAGKATGQTINHLQPG